MKKLRNSTHETFAAFACSISLTAASEDLSAIGLEEMKRLGFFKNAYRKAYFDRRTTQNSNLLRRSKISVVEDNEVRSEGDSTSKQAHVKLLLKCYRAN